MALRGLVRVPTVQIYQQKEFLCCCWGIVAKKLDVGARRGVGRWGRGGKQQDRVCVTS